VGAGEGKQQERDAESSNQSRHRCHPIDPTPLCKSVC
jgi:hypothetical protein